MPPSSTRRETEDGQRSGPPPTTRADTGPARERPVRDAPGASRAHSRLRAAAPAGNRAVAQMAARSLQRQDDGSPVPDPDRDGVRVTGEASESDAHGRVEARRTETGTGEDGSPTKTVTQGGAQVGLGTARVSGERSHEVDHGGGVTTTTTHGGSVDLSGAASAERKVATGSEGDRTTSTTGGAAQLGDTGIEGATISGKREHDSGRSVSWSAGYAVDITEPQLGADGQWTVSGTMTVSASAGGGLSSPTAPSGAGGPGAPAGGGSPRSYGGSLSMGGSTARRFTERFADEAAARAFYEDDTALFGMAQVAAFDGIDAEAVAALGVGESLGETVAASAGAGATASQGALQGSLTLGMQGDLAIDVERIAAHRVKVTLRSTTGGDIGGAFSTVGVGMGGSAGSSVISGAVIEYSTDSAAGSRALAAILTTRRPPTSPRGDGWVVTERITSGTEDRSSVSANVLVGGQSRSTTTVENLTDAEGNESVRVTGRRDDTVGSVLPDWIDKALGLSGSESVEMQSRSGQGLSLRFEIDGTDAAASNEALAEAIGEGYSSEISGEDGGKWTLTSSLSEPTFARIVEAIVTNSQSAATARAWLLTRADRGADLQGAVRAAANDPDTCRVLLADFVADLGPRGAGYIRRIAGDVQWDVQLAGSTTFTGADGLAAARAELATLSTRLDEGGSVVGPLESLLSRERQQLARIETDNPELPERLRAEQHARQAELVAEIQAVLRRARAALLADQPASVESEVEDLEQAGADPSTRMSGGDGPLESSVESHEASGAAVERERVRRQQARAALNGDIARMQGRNSEQRRARGPIVHERDLHDHGVGGWDGNDVPRSDLSGWFGGEGSTYERIDGRWTRAEEHRVHGEELAARATDICSALGRDTGLSPAAAAQVDEARRLSWQAHDSFARALGLWRELAHDYRGLRERNADHEAFQRVPYGESRRAHQVVF